MTSTRGVSRGITRGVSRGITRGVSRGITRSECSKELQLIRTHSQQLEAQLQHSTLFFKGINVRSYRLISSQLTSFLLALNWVARSAPGTDPVCCGCDQSDKSVWPTSFRLVAAMGNWVTSQCTHHHSFRMKWGQLRWWPDETSYTNAPSSIQMSFSVTRGIVDDTVFDSSHTTSYYTSSLSQKYCLHLQILPSVYSTLLLCTAE